MRKSIRRRQKDMGGRERKNGRLNEQKKNTIYHGDEGVEEGRCGKKEVVILWTLPVEGKEEKTKVTKQVREIPSSMTESQV